MRYIVFFGAMIGALFVVGGLAFSQGAPQEAAAAAMGVAFAVIPYVMFKVSSELEARAQRAQIIELLKQKQQ